MRGRENHCDAGHECQLMTPPAEPPKRPMGFVMPEDKKVKD